jgi:Na+/H+-translocating membrane pyrophosphatase
MQVVKEVRRQFRDNPDIMTFKAKPDYRSCVALVSITVPPISLPFSPHFRQ